MMLTFQVCLEEIISRQKIMTTRLETPSRKEYWEKHKTKGSYTPAETEGEPETLHNTWEEVCHLWWLNPRNQSPYCRKIATPYLDFIKKKKGTQFAIEDYRRDGFETMEEYIRALMKTNNMTRPEVMEATWYQYVWVPSHRAMHFEPWAESHPAGKCTDTFCPLCKERRETTCQKE